MYLQALRQRKTETGNLSYLNRRVDFPGRKRPAVN